MSAISMEGGSFILLSGGSNGEVISKKAIIFDESTDKESSCLEMSNQRCGHVSFKAEHEG